MQIEQVIHELENYKCFSDEGYSMYCLYFLTYSYSTSTGLKMRVARTLSITKNLTEGWA